MPPAAPKAMPPPEIQGCNGSRRALRAAAERPSPAQHIPDVSCPKPRAGTGQDGKELESRSTQPACFGTHMQITTGPRVLCGMKKLLSVKQKERFLSLYPSPALSGQWGGPRFAVGLQGGKRPLLPNLGCLHGKAGGKQEIPSCQEPGKRRWVLANIHPPPRGLPKGHSP